MSADDHLALIARTYHEVIEETAKETGWSRELCEARGLSPSELGALETVAEGDTLTESQTGWARQLEVWGLLRPDDNDEGWLMTEHGAQILTVARADREER